MRNGFRSIAPEPNEKKENLANGFCLIALKRLKSQKYLVGVETIRNGLRTIAPEPNEKKENLVLKSSDSSLNCKNADLCVPNVDLGDDASKTNTGDTVKEIDGESSRNSGSGVDVQKEMVVVAAVADTPDLPKTESLTNEKAVDQKTDMKAKKLLKVGSLTEKKGVHRKPNKNLKRTFFKCK